MLVLAGWAVGLDGCSHNQSAGSANLTVTVGPSDADVIGRDNSAIQTAIERVAAHGGGTVLIKAGTYTLYNSVRLASHVTLEGEGPEKTILQKGPGVASPLTDDADFGEDRATVRQAIGFAPGMGVVVLSKEYPGDLPTPTLYGYTAYPSSLRTIVRIEGNTLFLDRYLQNDYKVEWAGQVANAFPLVAGYDVEDTAVVGLTVDGNRSETQSLEDRMGAIYFLNSRKFAVRSCVARNFSGDGISCQFVQDATVENCDSYHNQTFGIHFGNGALRPVARNNRVHDNGWDGLYLCYRVRHGVFEKNECWANARDGISLGYKDTDNTLAGNVARENGRSGIYFRNESKLASNTANRNAVRENTLVDNGRQGMPGYGVWISSFTRDVTLESNTIRDTRGTERGTARVGIYLDQNADYITGRDNIIEGMKPAIVNQSRGRHISFEPAAP
jgi:parallel beta-helix repeat protein